MIFALYIKTRLGKAKLHSLQDLPDISSAVREILQRFPRYLGSTPASETSDRLVLWFRSDRGVTIGLGFDLLPEALAELKPYARQIEAERQAAKEKRRAIFARLAAPFQTEDALALSL